MSNRSLLSCLLLFTLTIASCSPNTTLAPSPTPLPPSATNLPIPSATPTQLPPTSTPIPPSPTPVPPSETPKPMFGQVSGILTHTYTKKPLEGVELVLLPVLKTSPKLEYGDFIEPSVFTGLDGAFLFDKIPVGKYALFIAPGVQGSGTMWSNPFSGAIIIDVKANETTELNVTYPPL